MNLSPEKTEDLLGTKTDFTDKESLQRGLNAVLEAINDGLVLIKNGIILYSNIILADILGYTVDEIIGMDILQPIAPHHKEFVKERYRKRMAGADVPTKYEIDLLHKDGKTLIPVLLSIGLLESVEDKLEFVLIRDLSEREKSEASLEYERRLLQYFMDYVPDSIFFKDKESRFIKVNQSTLSKFKLSNPKQLLGKTDHDFFTSEHADAAKADEIEVIQNQKSIVDKLEKETWPNGKTTWSSTTKIPLKDDNNNIIGTFGISRDVTSIKRIEIIRDALYNISTTITTVPDINELYKRIHEIIKSLMKADNFYIALFDDAKQTVRFPYFVDKYDQPPAERKAGLGLTEYILRKESAQLITAEMDLALREKGETNLIGEPAKIWLGVPLKTKNKTIGAIVVQDYEDETTYGDDEKEILTYVSEQIALAIDKKSSEEQIFKYSEELQEHNATKDKFFSIVAHDLKSPMQGLIGLTRMIHEEYDSMNETEMRSYVQILKESVENTYKLIENLLEWSRIQTGRMKYQPAIQNMFNIVEDTRLLLNQTARLKNISIRNKLYTITTIWGDQNMLQSLVQNLISNAIKFTKEGGIIEISENDCGEKIQYIFADNGVGIEAEDMEKIFRIDVSFSTRGTNQEKGTGLGLVLCKEIVNIHGGEIEIESEVDKGTKISFTMNKPK